MSTKFYDVIVAKEFQVIENGKPITRTKWRQVGSAWASKSVECGRRSGGFKPVKIT